MRGFLLHVEDPSLPNDRANEYFRVSRACGVTSCGDPGGSAELSASLTFLPTTIATLSASRRSTLAIATGPRRW